MRVVALIKRKHQDNLIKRETEIILKVVLQQLIEIFIGKLLKINERLNQQVALTRVSLVVNDKPLGLVDDFRHKENVLKTANVHREAIDQTRLVFDLAFKAEF